jgi:hypothetical protein
LKWPGVSEVRTASIIRAMTSIFQSAIANNSQLLYNKILPGYQPCQLVKRRKKHGFKDHLWWGLAGVWSQAVGFVLVHFAGSCFHI